MYLKIKLWLVEPITETIFCFQVNISWCRSVFLICRTCSPRRWPAMQISFVSKCHTKWQTCQNKNRKVLKTKRRIQDKSCEALLPRVKKHAGLWHFNFRASVLTLVAWVKHFTEWGSHKHRPGSSLRWLACKGNGASNLLHFPAASVAWSAGQPMWNQERDTHPRKMEEPVCPAAVPHMQ